MDELRPVDHKGAGSLQKSVDPSGRINRDDFDAVLDALARARVIVVEDALYEKDREVRRYKKVSLSRPEALSASHVELLISDGLAEEFATLTTQKGVRKAAKLPKKAGAAVPVSLSADGEALAGRLKEWRMGEAKRLRVPPYCVLHDRTITAVAFARPGNPRELLAIEGIGPGKVEKFGPAILKICGAK